MNTTLYIVIAVEAVLLVAAAIYITVLVMRNRQMRTNKPMKSPRNCSRSPSISNWRR